MSKKKIADEWENWAKYLSQDDADWEGKKEGKEEAWLFLETYAFAGRLASVALPGSTEEADAKRIARLCWEAENFCECHYRYILAEGSKELWDEIDEFCDDCQQLAELIRRNRI